MPSHSLVFCFHFWVGVGVQVMNGYRSGSALGLDPKLGKDVSPQKRDGNSIPFWHCGDARVGMGCCGGEHQSLKLLVVFVIGCVYGSM